MLKWIGLVLTFVSLTVGDPFTKYLPFYGRKVITDPWTIVVDKGSRNHILILIKMSQFVCCRQSGRHNFVQFNLQF